MIKLRQDIIFPSQFYKEPTLQGMENCEKQTVKKKKKHENHFITTTA